MQEYKFAFADRQIHLRSPFSLTFPSALSDDTVKSDLVVEFNQAADVGEKLIPGIQSFTPDSFEVTVYEAARFEVRTAVGSVKGKIFGDANLWTSRKLRDLLLAPPIEFALLPKGVFSLHASAVNTDKGIILFLGPSRSGKSTASRTWVEQLGGEIFSDDRIILAGDKIYSWPDNRMLHLKKVRLLVSIAYTAGEGASLCDLLPAAMGVRLLAATRLAGLTNEPPALMAGARKTVMERFFNILERSKMVAIKHDGQLIDILTKLKKEWQNNT